ncbi:hypothetical protein CB0940_02236 [Cercospora beticola]|uniref:Protein kinase domain-containing protein n=1 Tax=Cercospora beticola TaxID=122368 RepID=A0A2G5IA95_CERBT|nr:hypothetical protein CB0940_02236 [Cercospora beticola]PIB01680.1 hypothetical protein CB0940_02236 [Cercospora beticola]
MTDRQSRIPAQYDWQDAPQASVQHDGKPETAIWRVQRKRKGKSRDFEKDIYICKWQSLAGKNPTQAKYVFGECDMLQRFKHPNIVKYVDFDYNPSRQIARLFMENCSHGDLKKLGRKLNAGEAHSVLYQISNALLYIHHGVYHDGVKLKLGTFEALEVFISDTTKNGIYVKLGDFGVAKSDMEGTASYVGTNAYMAPEQRTAFRGPGSRRTTFRCDIYALGLTMEQLVDPNATALSSIFKECQARLDDDRPRSGAIVDQLRTLEGKRSLIDEMLSCIRTTTVAKLGKQQAKRIKTELNTFDELCERLLDSGSQPSGNVLQEFQEYAHGPGVVEWKCGVVEQVSARLAKHETDVRFADSIIHAKDFSPLSSDDKSVENSVAAAEKATESAEQASRERELKEQNERLEREIAEIRARLSATAQTGRTRGSERLDIGLGAKSELETTVKPTLNDRLERREPSVKGREQAGSLDARKLLSARMNPLSKPFVPSLVLQDPIKDTTSGALPEPNGVGIPDTSRGPDGSVLPLLSGTSHGIDAQDVTADGQREQDNRIETLRKSSWTARESGGLGQRRGLNSTFSKQTRSAQPLSLRTPPIESQATESIRGRRRDPLLQRDLSQPARRSSRPLSFSPSLNSNPADYFQVKGSLHEQLFEQYKFLQAQQDALRYQLERQQAENAEQSEREGWKDDKFERLFRTRELSF